MHFVRKRVLSSMLRGMALGAPLELWYLWPKWEIFIVVEVVTLTIVATAVGYTELKE